MSFFSCHDLTVTINNKLICENLNLEIAAGECWGLLGANGSGKTTLLKTFAGLHKPDSGNLFIKEKKLASLTRKSIAQQLGMLFQETQNNFEQTVLEYCFLGRHPHISRWGSETTTDKNLCLQALKQMDLAHLASQPISTLSGGERRRLSLAMLLAQAPNIFLLDEPTNHLDLTHQINMLEYFSSLPHASVCMALHDVRWAKLFCQKVIVLFPNGKVLLGNTREILTEKNLCALYDLPQHWLPVLNF